MVAKVPFEDIKIKLNGQPGFRFRDGKIGFRKECWIYDYSVSFDGIELLFPITVPDEVPEEDRDLMATLYLKAMIAAVAENVEVVL